MEINHRRHKVNVAEAKTDNAATEHVERKFFAGGYVLIATHAILSDEEYDLLKDWDETPLTYMMVKGDFLADYVVNDLEYDSLKTFLSEYTGESVENLRICSEQANALAFTYTPHSDTQFVFPEKADGSALLAFADFLSGVLQERGFEDAGKAINTLMSISH